MPGPLTWRNVDAPDFSTALQGMKQFSDMLNGAFNTAGNAVEKIDGIQTSAANKEIQAKLLQYQDPDAVSTALASGALFDGVDPRRISADTYKAAGNRATDILNYQNTKGDVNAELQARTIADSRRAAGLEVAPIVRQAYMLSATKGREAMLEYLSNPEVQPLLQKLEPDQFESLMSGQLRVGEDTLDYNGKRFNQDTSQLEYTETRQAAGDALKLMDESGATEATDFIGWMNTNREDLIKRGYSPTVLSKIRQRAIDDPQWGLLRERLNEEFSAAPPGAGGSVGSVTNDASSVMNYEAVASGIASVPASVKTLGDASDFALTVNDANKKRLGRNGSSAMGNFQIVGDTMRSYAFKVFGDNWRNQLYNLETQDKIAKAIFEDHRGSASALSEQWVSLKKGGLAERVRKMPWSEARLIIAKNESGADLRASGVASRVNIAINQASNPDIALYGDFIGAVKDNSPARALSKTATGKGGIFEGNPAAAIETKITEVADEYDISPALALAVLQRSTDGERLGINPARLFDGRSVAFNNAKIKRYGQLAQNRKGIQAAALANDAMNQTVAGLDTSDAQSTAARARAERGLRASEILGVKPGTASNARNVDKAIDAITVQQDARDQATGVSEGSNPAVDTPTTGRAKRAGQAQTRPTNKSTENNVSGGRQFGKFKVFVPEGKFKTQSELDRYVGAIEAKGNEASQALAEATKIGRVGGIVGQRLLEEFRKKWGGRTPTQVADRARQVISAISAKSKG